MSAVAYAHIEHTSSNVPIVAGTTTKVIELALDHIAHRWDADEIQRQHPHLSLGQIHSALAYYFDHQVELDRQIAAQIEEVERLRAASGPSVIAAKLRELGRMP